MLLLSIGYRVKSAQGTEFRIWATKTLREFIIKGFVLDDGKLENGSNSGKDYFDELLERIREIRTSERRFYQKIIYAQCSIDYDRNSDVSKNFYAIGLLQVIHQQKVSMENLEFISIEIINHNLMKELKSI